MPAAAVVEQRVANFSRRIAPEIFDQLRSQRMIDEPIPGTPTRSTLLYLTDMDRSPPGELFSHQTGRPRRSNLGAYHPYFARANAAPPLQERIPSNVVTAAAAVAISGGVPEICAGSLVDSTGVMRTA